MVLQDGLQDGLEKSSEWKNCLPSQLRPRSKSNKSEALGLPLMQMEREALRLEREALHHGVAARDCGAGRAPGPNQRARGVFDQQHLFDRKTFFLPGCSANLRKRPGQSLPQDVRPIPLTNPQNPYYTNHNIFARLRDRNQNHKHTSMHPHSGTISPRRSRPPGWRQA